MKDMNINQLVAELQRGIVCVTFTKVDGSEREMHCTLKREFMPKDMLPKNPDKEYDNRKMTTVSVYDVSADGWRSFRIDSVKDWY